MFDKELFTCMFILLFPVIIGAIVFVIEAILWKQANPGKPIIEWNPKGK